MYMIINIITVFVKTTNDIISAIFFLLSTSENNFKYLLSVGTVIQYNHIYFYCIYFLF